MKIEICDVCGYEQYGKIWDDCVICKREMCFSCKKDLYDVFHLGICKDCDEIEEVKNYIQKALKFWRLKGVKLAKEAPKIKRAKKNFVT